jgi:hypothetical protein
VREVVGVAGGEVAGLEQVGGGDGGTLWGGARAMGLMTLAIIKTTFHSAMPNFHCRVAMEIGPEVEEEEEEEEGGGEGEGDGGQAEVAAGKRLRVGTSSFKKAGLVDEVAAAVQEEGGGRGARKVDGVEVRVWGRDAAKGREMAGEDTFFHGYLD